MHLDVPLRNIRRGRIASALILAGLLGVGSRAEAAVAVTAIETSPAATGNVLSRGDYSLTSVTAGGEDYSELELPGSVTLPSTGGGTADFYFWANATNPTTNSPGSADNALNDAYISTGAANAIPTILFARSLDQYERFFLFELGSNDALTLTAVDEEGADLDLTLSFASSAWGSVATGASANTATGASTGTASGFQRSDEQTGQGLLTLPVGGVMITPAEFTGTGNLADAFGFRVDSTSNGYDHMFAAAVPVPEPASFALLGIGGWLCLGRRRLA